MKEIRTSFADYRFTSEFSGVPIIESPFATRRVEDWSGCRSIPRAKRRHAKGKRTRMRIIEKPACFQMDGKFYMHPEFRRELERQLADRIERNFYASILGARP